MNRFWDKKAANQENHWQEGSIGDLLSVGLCILAMIAVMAAFMDCAAVINRKTAISQTARGFILRMETVGYLTAAEEGELLRQLAEAGLQDISLEGTTREPVGYGSEIVLHISGRMGDGYVVEEKRVSTAKH